MYIHSKDSLSLLKGIMTVQEELDKFHIDLPKDQSKSSGRESKVSPKIHRLRDPLRSRTPHDRFNSKENYHSKASRHDLSWHEDSRPEKSKDKKGSFFTIPNSVTSRDSVQESLTKRPPSQPRSVLSTNMLSEASSENTSFHKNQEYKSNYSSGVFDRLQTRDSYREQQSFNHGISHQVSVYNDDQTTKTHLMNPKPALHPEHVKSSHERLRSQAIMKANAMNFISRSMSTSCDVTRDYGNQDKNSVSMSRFVEKEQQKQNENVAPQHKNIPVEYNGTFSVNNLLKKETSSPQKSKENNKSRKKEFEEPNSNEGSKENSINHNKKTTRTQSSRHQGDPYMKNAPEINRLLSKDWQKPSRESLKALKQNLNLSYQGQEEPKIKIQERKSIFENENIGATGSFRTLYENKKNLENRSLQLPEQNRLSVPITKEKARFHDVPTNRGSYRSHEHSKSFTIEEGDLDNFDIKAVNSKEKIKGNSERSQLMKTILDLKNQIHERDLEILELRNMKVSNEIENKELQAQANEALKQSKHNEDNIRKFQHQVECQEKEIEFLKKCKQRLEESSKNAHKTNTELKDYMAKAAKYEALVEEKSKESSELAEKLKQVETEAKPLKESHMKIEFEIRELRDEIKRKDDIMQKTQNELQEARTKLEEYKLIITKLGELEELQNQLIRENDSLKIQLKQEQTRVSEAELQNAITLKEELPTLFLTNKKLKEIDDYAKRLMTISESAIKGEEPPIELILKHNRGKDNLGHQRKVQDHELKGATIKALNQQNLALSETLHQTYTSYMDRLCENYALKYGNDCNLQ